MLLIVDLDTDMDRDTDTDTDTDSDKDTDKDKDTYTATGTRTRNTAIDKGRNKDRDTDTDTDMDRYRQWYRHWKGQEREQVHWHWQRKGQGHRNCQKQGHGHGHRQGQGQGTNIDIVVDLAEFYVDGSHTARKFLQRAMKPVEICLEGSDTPQKCFQRGITLAEICVLSGVWYPAEIRSQRSDTQLACSGPGRIMFVSLPHRTIFQNWLNVKIHSRRDPYFKRPQAQFFSLFNGLLVPRGTIIRFEYLQEFDTEYIYKKIKGMNQRSIRSRFLKKPETENLMLQCL